MGRKSLADEIAELANPRPTREVDPELDAFESGPVLEESDDELLETGKTKGKERPRLRGDILLGGKEYRGHKSSRSAVFGDENDQEDLENGFDEEEEEERSSSSADLESEGGISEEEEEERMQSSMQNGFNPLASEVELLEKEYRDVQVEDSHSLSALKERAVKERQKSLAVASQKKIWNRSLEIRILLQKVLQGANRLPQSEGHQAIAMHDTGNCEHLVHLAKDAADTLDDMLCLLEALEAANPAVKESAEKTHTGIKRNRERNSSIEMIMGMDELWERLDTAYNRFGAYRDASIDRWHRKTVLSSGMAARGGLRALNQSVSSQVAAFMKDRERAVERTRLPLHQCSVLCSVSEDQKLTRTGTKDFDAEEIDDARDPETYDDGEFYQTLLKEFLEGKQVAGSVANWYSGKKHRKLVDRRASKGRKLRYHVHEKLVNFMTPVELHAPQFAANIFANLFGRGSES